mmetsp:Transcript_129714/g.225356  ORF Transcript_129714/g.225356 Transcript_129714/m.225356 type:complete len:251 (+) Transcript_129714:111-863(+)
MALLVALAFTFSLANGHRIQPSAVMTRKFHGPSPTKDSPLSADDRTVSHDAEGHKASTQKQAAFENFAHVSSMIQQQMSSTTLKTAFDKARSSSRKFLGEAPLPVTGSVIVSGFVALFWLVGALAQHLLSRSKGSRIQYIHDGRVVYEWDQSPKAVIVYIKPPKGMTKGDLDIRIASRHLRVGRKDKPSFLAEETYDLVNEQMSSWCLRSNGELQIILRKARRGLWPVLLMHTDAGNRKFAKDSKKRQEK